MEVLRTVCAILAVVALVESTGAEELPTGYRLPVGQSLRFKVTIKDDGGVDVGLCDALRSCSFVTILGMAHGRIGLNWNATSTTNCLSDWVSLVTVEGSSGWKYGEEVTFVARRDSDSLVVWVDGRPEETVFVTVAPGQDQLKFNSFVGPVEVLDIPGRTTEGYPLAVGEQVSVRFQSDPDRLSSPCIAMCGSQDCIQAMVLGVDGQDWGYHIGRVSYNQPGSDWSYISERVDKPSGLPLGEYWFEVLRTSPQKVQIWPREIPDWQVDLDTTASELKVWTDTFGWIPRTWANVAIFSNNTL